MTLLTVLLLAGFVGLGRWQWHRGEAKQSVWAEYEKVTAPMHVPAGDLDRVDRFAHVEVDGHYEPEHQFLLDNRSHAGQPGYEVLTPFRLESGVRLLVNRGWVPFTGYRDRPPDISLADTATRRIAGRIEELPAAGLASGRAPPSTNATWPKLTSFPTHEELEAALGSHLTRRLLLLDPGMPEGYVREWTPPGLPPTRHFSYAIQWWGFAVVLLVLYFGLNFRKVS
jgi:cytochrome oxidase assembly protein ShyY1